MRLNAQSDPALKRRDAQVLPHSRLENETQCPIATITSQLIVSSCVHTSDTSSLLSKHTYKLPQGRSAGCLVKQRRTRVCPSTAELESTRLRVSKQDTRKYKGGVSRPEEVGMESAD